jgi:hemerythrin-like domain-containing protein
VEQQGRELLATLREHMRLEDQEAFPIAAEVLTAEDWEALLAQAPTVEDPVFGKADPERFRALYTQLRAEMRQ